MIRVIIFIVLSITHLTTSAQEIITDRPDQTESSSTIPKGSLQIEAGVLIESSKNDVFSERQILAPTVLWRYGVTKGFELRALTQFESIKNKLTDETYDGISDLEVGTKIQLLRKEGVNTEIAFLSHIVIPTASQELTNDKLGTINKLSISHSISEAIGLGYNVGYDYFGEGNGNVTYSLAFGIGLGNNFGMYLEPYGALLDIEKHEASFDAGITYLPQENLQLDISYGTGLNHNMNYFSVGCSINIAKKSKDQ